ncbi:hypothetical protein J576_1026 [Acinetobacter sp. 766875]|nr:hypothetical protein J576_1026 [Acinetobacter sp. 766875]
MPLVILLKMYIFSYSNGLLIVPSCLGSKWKLEGEKGMRITRKIM